MIANSASGQNAIMIKANDVRFETVCRITPLYRRSSIEIRQCRPVSFHRLIDRVLVALMIQVCKKKSRLEARVCRSTLNTVREPKSSVNFVARLGLAVKCKIIVLPGVKSG